MAFDYFQFGKAAAEASIDAHEKRIDAWVAYQFLRDAAHDGMLMVVGTDNGVAFAGDELDISVAEALTDRDRRAFLAGYHDGDPYTVVCALCGELGRRRFSRQRGGYWIGSHCCMDSAPPKWTAWLWHITGLRWERIGEFHDADPTRVIDVLADQSLPWVVADDNGTPQYWRQTIEIQTFIDQMVKEAADAKARSSTSGRLDHESAVRLRTLTTAPSDAGWLSLNLPSTNTRTMNRSPCRRCTSKRTLEALMRIGLGW